MFNVGDYDNVKINKYIAYVCIYTYIMDGINISVIGRNSH